VDEPSPFGRAKTRWWWAALGTIAVVALAWRVGYTLATHGDDSRLFDEGDAFVYSALAHESADGRWFEDPFGGSHVAEHPPLTVVALLPASAAFDGSVLAQRLTMSVIGALAVGMIGLVGRAVAGPAAGLGAAGFATANPNLWINDALVMSESLAALVVGIVLLFAVRLWRDGEPSGRMVIGFGAACGLAMLCRAELGLFLPFVVAPALGWRRWRGIALAAGAAAVVVLPWSAWSTIELDRPVLMSTNDTTTLLGANCHDTYFDGNVGTWSLFCVTRSQRAGESTADAIHYVRTHLGRLPLVVVAREGRTFGFWRPGDQVRSNVYEGRPGWASWAGYVAFWLLLPVTLAGAVALRRRKDGPLFPFVACAVIVVVVSGAFYGLPRFRLPLDVATCVLAAYATCAAYASFSRRATASSITS